METADYVEVTFLVDNRVDYISPLPPELGKESDLSRLFGECETDHADLPMDYDKLCFAAHGFSVLIKAKKTSKNLECNVIVDAGPQGHLLLDNIRKTKNENTHIHAIILTHWHSDHSLGLPELIQHYASRQSSLSLYLPHTQPHLRSNKHPRGKHHLLLPHPSLDFLSDLPNVSVHLSSPSLPTLLSPPLFLISSPTPRITSFEEGLPHHYQKKTPSSPWIKDPLVQEERNVLFSLENLGLFIVTGCCHAGVVNSVLAAQKETKTPLYGLLGGLHLSDRSSSSRLEATLTFLEKECSSLRYVISSHCTGDVANQRLQHSRFPWKVVLSSVGLKIVLRSELLQVLEERRREEKRGEERRGEEEGGEGRKGEKGEEAKREERGEEMR